MLIKNGTLITPENIIENCDVKIKNGTIIQIGTNLSDDAETINAYGTYLCPGFIDIHTHGGGGGDFMDADDDSFDRALGFHCRNGTTSILPTSVTAPIEQIEDMLSVVRRYMKKDDPVCRIIGAHLEGPYISFKNKGAQHEKYLRIPAKDPYDFILDNSDIIKTVTISPELEGSYEMTERLTKAQITVAGGHDDGERRKILPVIEAGLKHCTHLWCAMSTVAVRNGVRDIGLCELGLIDDRLSVEIIADNHHITPEMARLIYKCKGAGKMCIVSDCLRAGGMKEDGKLYILGSKKDKYAQKFIVSGGVARLPDGSRFAGSIQPINEMLKNLVNDAKIPLKDAVRCATLTPAQIIGVDDMYGSVEVGKTADICLLDRDLNVIQTIIGGKTMYKK